MNFNGHCLGHIPFAKPQLFTCKKYYGGKGLPYKISDFKVSSVYQKFNILKEVGNILLRAARMQFNILVSLDPLLLRVT